MATKFNDEVDQLFKLPLAEFTGARNELAKRLKQSGRANDANLVKTLAKPSISAWTVNQLYWNHRDEFEQLLAAGRRFRKAQTSAATGKVADMRESLDARREALVQLSDLASSLLQDTGHNPTAETIRRVTTTLEAISALSDGPTAGRLTQDVDPPGFESLASFVPAAAKIREAKPVKASDTRQLEQTRQARINAAKVSLQTAKKSLADARARAQSFEAAQKKAQAEVKLAEKQLREAEERFKRASAAAKVATQRSQSIEEEAREALKAVEDAKRDVEKASKELEALFGEG